MHPAPASSDIWKKIGLLSLAIVSCVQQTSMNSRLRSTARTSRTPKPGRFLLLCLQTTEEENRGSELRPGCFYGIHDALVSTARMRCTPVQDASCSCVFRLLTIIMGTLEPRHGQLYVSLFAVVVGWIEVKLKTHGADEATPHARLSAPGCLPTLEESHGESEPESIPHDTDTGQHG